MIIERAMMKDEIFRTKYKDSSRKKLICSSGDNDCVLLIFEINFSGRS